VTAEDNPIQSHSGQPEKPPQIVGLGLASLDVLIRVDEMPCWEQGGGFSAFGLDGGGPVGTACVAAAKLGAHVGFIGTAGDDENAALKLQSFYQVGVDLSRLVVRAGPESKIILVYIHQTTGERVFYGLRSSDRQPLKSEEIDRDYLTSMDYLLLDGFEGASLDAAKWMHQAGKKVMLDGHATHGPLSEEMRALVSETDYLICGSGFAPALTNKSDIWEAGKAALLLGPQVVVQTEGADGSYTVNAAGDCFHIPAFDVPVLDTTGAGDVFHGAFLVGLARGWDIRKIVIFSTAVSGIKCTRLGGRKGIPTFEETINFLQNRGFHEFDGP